MDWTADSYVFWLDSLLFLFGHLRYKNWVVRSQAGPSGNLSNHNTRRRCHWGLKKLFQPFFKFSKEVPEVATLKSRPSSERFAEKLFKKLWAAVFFFHKGLKVAHACDTRRSLASLLAETRKGGFTPLPLGLRSCTIGFVKGKVGTSGKQQNLPFFILFKESKRKHKTPLTKLHSKPSVCDRGRRWTKQFFDPD